MISRLGWLGFSLFLLAAFVLLVFAADRDSDREIADRLIAEALKPSPLETNLRRLSDEIGGRVPGTPAFQRAVDWGVAAFEEAGAESVHTEEFTIRHSWAEGATEMTASLYSGTTFPVHAVSVAWAPALATAKHVPIVDVGEGSAAEFAKVGDVAGRIVLVHTKVLASWDDLFGEYARAPAVIALAVKGKAKAIAFMATREHGILYRHTNSVAGEIDALPQVVVAREDGERIVRLLASANPVWANLSIPNKIGAALKTWNVVAEIRGSEKPDEFMVLGAHLDSWELGTGALDNGCNAALVIDALRAIKASGLKPRRSIRFILFSGEEEGLIGSRAYAMTHRNDLDKAVGVVIFDSGTGKTTAFSTGGRKDVIPAAESMLAPLEQFGVTKAVATAESGTDHFDFMLEGVPTFVADQAEANYMENYHATTDTFDKVDFPQLKKNVAEAAELAFALANAADRIGPRLNRTQIEQTLHETHLDQELKDMGMWDEWANGKRGREQ
ncbi:MAG TPA: M20/M25/M40 family metallo-hydrolase [Terriglobales bacterium]|nr:M20/M25/M40 family metallo-hydrolase [Terriglobales bacterium]